MAQATRDSELLFLGRTVRVYEMELGPRGECCNSILYDINGKCADLTCKLPCSQHSHSASRIACKKINASSFVTPTTFGAVCRLPLIFCPKPPHPAARSVCDSLSNFQRTWTHVHVRCMSSSVRLSSVCRVSVCLSSITCVHYSGDWNFRRCFYAVWYGAR